MTIRPIEYHNLLSASAWVLDVSEQMAYVQTDGSVCSGGFQPNRLEMLNSSVYQFAKSGPCKDSHFLTRLEVRKAAKRSFDRSVTVRSNDGLAFVFNKSAIGGWGGAES